MSSTVHEQPASVDTSDDLATTMACSSTSSDVDIDGIPLRGGDVKIDLKNILGHMPDVDDDEDEQRTTNVGTCQPDPCTTATVCRIEEQFQPIDDDDLEFGVDDDDNEADDIEVNRPRKRRSSLKTMLHPMSPGHPTADDSLESPQSDELSPDHSHKAVRFADSLGLGLADIHDLVNSDEPPTIPPSALRDLHIRRRKRSKSQLSYQLDFEQPGSDPVFITRVLANKVSLENCVACNDRSGDHLTISGIIRVANVAFDKQLTVRYTVDNWQSLAGEIVATYLPGSNDGATDRFAFVIELSPAVVSASLSMPGTRLEFAISYTSGGDIFWDSNDGKNYGVNCVVAGDAIASI